MLKWPCNFAVSVAIKVFYGNINTEVKLKR